MAIHFKTEEGGEISHHAYKKLKSDLPKYGYHLTDSQIGDVLKSCMGSFFDSDFDQNLRAALREEGITNNSNKDDVFEVWSAIIEKGNSNHKTSVFVLGICLMGAAFGIVYLIWSSLSDT
jgi:hypothetical protein